MHLVGNEKQVVALSNGLQEVIRGSGWSSRQHQSRLVAPASPRAQEAIVAPSCIATAAQEHMKIEILEGRSDFVLPLLQQKLSRN
jgi:hypothetical protein